MDIIVNFELLGTEISEYFLVTPLLDVPKFSAYTPTTVCEGSKEL